MLESISISNVERRGGTHFLYYTFEQAMDEPKVSHGHSDLSFTSQPKPVTNYTVTRSRARLALLNCVINL